MLAVVLLMAAVEAVHDDSAGATDLVEVEYGALNKVTERESLQNAAENVEFPREGKLLHGRKSVKGDFRNIIKPAKTGNSLAPFLR